MTKTPQGFGSDDATPAMLAALGAGRPEAGIANTVHGAYFWISNMRGPACRRCILSDECEEYAADGRCQQIEELYTTTLRQVMALPQVEPIDAPLAAEFARWTCVAVLIDQWTDAVGMFKLAKDERRLDYQPVLTLRGTATSKLLQLSEALGLSPAARQRLKTNAETGVVFIRHEEGQREAQ